MIFQYNLPAICGVVERPTLRSCRLRVCFGRVVALLQRLPCQKAKPKGLC
ncbi:hypothetical protein GCWU000325_00445 [Alloprevotella tannerae ATCC 51259]|uniref:Uncharacterized protein n=1 Tax=Alloprevotella tannerae ATCC 51259 TaxID=626522 RepID=C9LE21_9BACT|nr:hypothetical protein GCWU000325_00445 [Alloprevotella tannerae ATCC 51259]